MRNLGFSVIIFSLLVVACNKSERKSPINLSHALSLIDSVAVNGEQLYYIAIYADYPEYKPVAAKGEGIACVDDAGRFLEVLESEILLSGNRTLLPTAKGLTKFLLYMCRDDGRWYNFLESDGQINTEHVNSQADFGWWAVRGIRGLTAAYLILKQFPEEAELLNQVEKCLRTTLRQMDADLAQYPLKVAGNFGSVPAWLIKSAPDMNSELLMALCKLQLTGDFNFKVEIRKIAEGLVGFQFRRDGHPLNGMYFCWQNSWHDWGAKQPLALVEAFKITGDSTFYKSVEIWADNFVPFLIANDLPREITLNQDGSYRLVALPQIAYGINALYSGIQAFADLSGKNRYHQFAARIFNWFGGGNLARAQMYWPETGVTSDGIDEDKKVNRNSGAESTIEGLLAQQRKFYRN
ncbi:MAG: hypothetical protein COT43_01565 [Candidatus Marinimicrobia bacterium CG08_land_8_20_14_0_20_45_22]|nr:MAG: hypothetical protein COT43_01565 [Candidatus Marinimicrobia bacterium CG08_land_8_20_14_0_20_45_22]